MKLSPLFSAAALTGALAFTACAGKSQATASAPTAATAPSPVPGTRAPSPATPEVSSFKETAKADPATVTPYPFTTCAVIRKDLEGSPKYRRVYKNQEVIFCCTPCLRTFDANPEPYMPRIVEAAAAKAQGETVNSGW
jgi:YHS domain-containing protein